jgi:hypothetical protein
MSGDGKAAVASPLSRIHKNRNLLAILTHRILCLVADYLCVAVKDDDEGCWLGPTAPPANATMELTFTSEESTSLFVKEH